jgi:hypothetical protein
MRIGNFATKMAGLTPLIGARKLLVADRLPLIACPALIFDVQYSMFEKPNDQKTEQPKHRNTETPKHRTTKHITLSTTNTKVQWSAPTQECPHPPAWLPPWDEFRIDWRG